MSSSEVRNSETLQQVWGAAAENQQRAGDVCFTGEELEMCSSSVSLQELSTSLTRTGANTGNSNHWIGCWFLRVRKQTEHSDKLLVWIHTTSCFVWTEETKVFITSQPLLHTATYWDSYHISITWHSRSTYRFKNDLCHVIFYTF